MTLCDLDVSTRTSFVCPVCEKASLTHALHLNQWMPNDAQYAHVGASTVIVSEIRVGRLFLQEGGAKFASLGSS